MPPRDSDAPDDSTPDDAEAVTDASGDATHPEQLLAAVQDAALERALLDDYDAARHLALAGGLERARRDAAEGDAPERSGPFGSALLAVTTLAAFDVTEDGELGVGSDGAVPGEPERPSASPGTASPWRPAPPSDVPADVVERDSTNHRDPQTANDAVGRGPMGDRNAPRSGGALVEGAALAVRRFDADVRRAAALADVSVATLARRIESSCERR